MGKLTQVREASLPDLPAVLDPPVYLLHEEEGHGLAGGWRFRWGSLLYSRSATAPLKHFDWDRDRLFE